MLLAFHFFLSFEETKQFSFSHANVTSRGELNGGKNLELKQWQDKRLLQEVCVKDVTHSFAHVSNFIEHQAKCFTLSFQRPLLSCNYFSASIEEA